MTLSIEVRRGATALSGIEAAWKELFREAGDGAPFRSYEWTSAWWERLGNGRVPHVLTAWDGERLAGVMALGEESLRPAKFPLPVRRLSFLNERHGGADYLGVLAAATREEEITHLFVEHLANVRPFDLLELEAIAEGSPLLAELARRFGVEPDEQFLCPAVDLSGTFADVLARGSRGDNYKRRLKQLRAMPGFELRRVKDPSEAVAAFDRFLALHETRWADQGGSDAMAGNAIRDFHRDVVVQLAQAGRLSFDELWVDGGCRATVYGIDAGTSYCFYQSGYDPAWAQKSVGLVCLGLSIEAAQASGAKVYDLLRGTEKYKFDWATQTRKVMGVRVVGRTVGTLLLQLSSGAEAAARGAAHAVLPASAVQLLRKWRRSREHRA